MADFAGERVLHYYFVPACQLYSRSFSALAAGYISSSMEQQLYEVLLFLILKLPAE